MNEKELKDEVARLLCHNADTQTLIANLKVFFSIKFAPGSYVHIKKSDLGLTDHQEIREKLRLTNLYTRFDDPQTICCQKQPDNHVFPVFFCRIKDSVLNERSCRKDQFAFARNMMEFIQDGNGCFFKLDGVYPENAIFIFADNSGHFRLSLIEGEEPGQKTNKKRFRRYTFYVDPAAKNRTFIDRMAMDWSTFDKIKDAFSVERLSDEFFNEYKRIYLEEVQTGSADTEIMAQFAKFGDREMAEKAFRDYVKKTMGRLVFLQFLQKKGWLGVPEDGTWGSGDTNYLQNLFAHSDKKDDFLEAVLEPLFFKTLNTDRGEASIADEALSTVPGQKIRIPYLNGGLFERDALDDTEVKFPAKFFARSSENEPEGLLDIFDRFNFTIDENGPGNVELGVDPEMLGRIFENLLEDNKDKGAFYTPKEIVNYMCRESLIQYLGDTEENRKLVTDVEYLGDTAVTPDSAADADAIPEEHRTALIGKLKAVKICDPAIGSGAFPMGMLNLLLQLRIKLGDVEDTYECRLKTKKEIIQNNLYGVDIDAGAVDIARLRFWLSVVVDEDKPTPLPNLDYKIMQGNSLLESFMGVDLSSINPGREKVEIKKRGRKSVVTQNVALPQQKEFDLYGEGTTIDDILDDMSRFFNESNHKQRDEIRKRIHDNVITLICKSADNDGTIKEDKRTEIKEKARQLELKNAPFFLWHLHFADVFAQGGFDIVIGNPPYLKEGRIGRSLFAQYRQDMYYEGKMDLWQIFACRGIDMLKGNGSLCFIATNNWTTNAGAKKMRNKIILDAKIKQMVDFGTYMIFKDSASIQTMIMQFVKDSKVDNYTFDWRFLNPGSSEFEMLALLHHEQNHLCSYKYPMVNRTALRNKLLTFSGDDNFLQRLSVGKVYLKGDEVAQGIISPQDSLNKKGRDKLNCGNVGDGIFVLSQQELNSLELSNREKELIKPYFTSKQIHRYHSNCRNESWIIYTDSSFKNSASMNGYPNLKAHLDKFLSIFTSDNRPYGLHRSRDQHFFRGEKILSLRKCADRPLFSFSDFECYVPQTFFVIQTSRWDMKFLTGVLNSKLIAYWLRHKGKMQGNNYQVDKAPLLGIPLVNPPRERQQPFIDLVDRILQLKSQNIDADIAELEKQIDDLVYELYGLTTDEIEVVERSFEKTEEIPVAVVAAPEPEITEDDEDDNSELS